MTFQRHKCIHYIILVTIQLFGKKWMGHSLEIIPNGVVKGTLKEV